MCLQDYPALWREPAEMFLDEIEFRSTLVNRVNRESRLRMLVAWAAEQGIEFKDFTKYNVMAYIRERTGLGRSENIIKHDFQTAKMFWVCLL